MNLFGIEFDPLDLPLHKRLETFWAGFWFISFVFSVLVFIPPFLYLFYTSFWWTNLIVICWIYLDRKSCEQGGYRKEWVENWSCWRYTRDFYTAKLLCDEEFKLDPSRNYLFCCFPHGIVPTGPCASLFFKCSKFRQLYPNFDVKQAVININFFVPILREVMLTTGFISCSQKSLNFVLSKPEGGNAVILTVGGAEEAFHSKPGQYKLFVKNRKGFVKLALKNGTPLVPTITFGENDGFVQFDNPVLKKVQKFVKKYTGFAPVIFNGRGLFQNSFGLFPRRRQLTTVLGRPIDVEKVENPTNQQIDELHGKFIKKLVQLFEKFKHRCLENPEVRRLELI